MRVVLIILLLSSRRIAWFVKRPVHILTRLRTKTSAFSVRIIGALANEGSRRPRGPDCHTWSLFFMALIQNVPGKFIILCDWGAVFATLCRGNARGRPDLHTHTHTLEFTVHDSTASAQQSPPHSLYPTSGSQTALGFLRGRFVLESEPPRDLMSAAVCPSVRGCRIRCVHVTLEQCRRRHGPGGEVWHTSRADRSNQGSKAAWMFSQKRVLVRCLDNYFWFDEDLKVVPWR